jgi:DoxX
MIWQYICLYLDSIDTYPPLSQRYNQQKNIEYYTSTNDLTLTSFCPLLIRILVGALFIAHGLPKFSDIAGNGGFFASVGLPDELALPIMLLEIIDGMAHLVEY